MIPLRPQNVSKPLKIRRIKIERAALDTMSPDTRRIFLLFGHVANEMNTLTRLLIFSIRKQNDPVVALFGEARAATITRILIGTTMEGYLAVERFVLSSRFGNTYLPYLDPRGQETLAEVRRQLGDRKLMAAIRNNFAFHLPRDHQIDTAYSRLPDDADLSIYSDLPRHTSIYCMSSIMMTRGMLDCTEQTDDLTDKQAMKQIVDDVLDKSKCLNDFIEQLLKTIVDRENLSPGEPEVVLTLDGVMSMSKFEIPPLLRS